MRELELNEHNHTQDGGSTAAVKWTEPLYGPGQSGAWISALDGTMSELDHDREVDDTPRRLRRPTSGEARNIESFTEEELSWEMPRASRDAIRSGSRCRTASWMFSESPSQKEIYWKRIQLDLESAGSLSGINSCVVQCMMSAWVVYNCRAAATIQFLSLVITERAHCAIVCVTFHAIFLVAGTIMNIRGSESVLNSFERPSHSSRAAWPRGGAEFLSMPGSSESPASHELFYCRSCACRCAAVQSSAVCFYSVVNMCICMHALTCTAVHMRAFPLPSCVLRTHALDSLSCKLELLVRVILARPQPRCIPSLAQNKMAAPSVITSATAYVQSATAAAADLQYDLLQ